MAEVAVIFPVFLRVGYICGEHEVAIVVADNYDDDIDVLTDTLDAVADQLRNRDTVHEKLRQDR